MRHGLVLLASAWVRAGSGFFPRKGGAVKSMLAPRRLALSQAEYANLVLRLNLTMPAGWDPAAVFEPVEAGLCARGVLTGSGDLIAVHPSVAKSLRILAGAQVLLDTTVTMGNHDSRSLHVVAGHYGASLFTLPEGGIELSLFAAIDLGRELGRAVPPEVSGDTPSTPADPDTMRGRVRLAGLERMNTATVVVPGTSEPDSADEAEAHADGSLRCAMTGRTSEGVRTSQVTWLHTSSGWVGLRPDADGSGKSVVRLEPAAREQLGPWTAPFVAAVLT